MNVQAIRINKDNVNILCGNWYYDLTADTDPLDVPCNCIEWSSSDPNIVVIHPTTGVMFGKSVGTTTVRATSCDIGRPYSECIVYVLPEAEYHIIPYSDINSSNKRALQVKMETVNSGDGINRLLRLSNDEKLELSNFSYVNKQKWLIKTHETSYKICSQHGDDYYLCKKGNDVYVSDNTNYESDISIIQYNYSSDLFKIKLVDSNLYLTASGNNITWSNFNSTNPDSQIWKFEEKPANIHNGVDSSVILKEPDFQSIKAGNEEFICRYYKILDTIDFETRKVELFTKGTELYNGITMSRLDATILKLYEEGIDLDVQNYLNYADTTSITDDNLYKGSGESLTTIEKNMYLNNINIVSVYQNDGTKYEYFTENHAKLDAFCALLSAKFLGQTPGTTIYFAVDYNASVSELGRIQTYFQTIKNKIGGRYKIGVYGNGLVCNKIKQELGIAHFSWLSQSTGHSGYSAYDTPIKYNIKQSEYVYYNQSEFDNNIAVGNDYGQW